MDVLWLPFNPGAGEHWTGSQTVADSKNITLSLILIHAVIVTFYAPEHRDDDDGDDEAEIMEKSTLYSETRDEV